MESIDKIEILKSVTAFSGADEKTLSHLAEIAELMRFEGGDQLIAEGSKMESLLVSVDGEYTVFSGGGKTPEKEIFRFHGVEVIGEIGAVSGIEATASVRAVGPASVLKIQVNEFHSIMSRNPRLAESVLRSMRKYLNRPDSFSDQSS